MSFSAKVGIAVIRKAAQTVLFYLEKYSDALAHCEYLDNRALTVQWKSVKALEEAMTNALEQARGEK